MAATLVQSAEGTSTLATVTASFATTPTNGNIIVLCFAADDYNGTPDAGWTQSTGMAIEGGSYHGGYVWWKVASGGSNSFQYTIGSASPSAWVLLEISGLDGSPYDVSNGQYVNASGYQYTTPSITPSAGDRFVVAAFGGSNASSGDISGDFVNWTNSFTHALSAGNPGTSGTRDCIGVGYRSVTANGSTSYSTGVDFPNTVQSRSGMIIAFKVASGGGGQSITGSLFTNSNSFYGATVGRGTVNISGALYSDADTFYAATLGTTYAITGARFDNSAQFYAATVAPGTVTISGALFTDGDTFYAAAVVRGAVDIAGSLYTDPDSFYAATVGQAGAPQNIDGALFSNANALYGATVSTSYTVSGALYSDADAFYAATTAASYAIGGALYTDPDTFFAASISQPNTPQTITGQLYANDNQFFGGVVIGGAQPTESDQPDTHDGRVWDFSQSERDEQERTKARRASEKQLRRAIERAVNTVQGSTAAPSLVAPVEASRPQVADLVLRDINTNGLSASLESIERLLAQYEAQIADEELENDALALLLMAA